MQGMTVRRVASPEYQEVCAVLDLPQSASDFTTQLGGDFCWTVSQRSVAVDHASHELGESHCSSLRFTGRIAEPVYQRHVRLVKMLGGRLHGVVQ